jgi:molybdenum cofactor cytidylyltransferase
MGGPNKMLLPWGESTVIGTVVKTLIDCDLEVLVVTGRDHEEVARAAAPARIVFNPDYESGLGSSIAAGAKACEDCDGILIALGDMPSLRSDAIKSVIKAWAGVNCIAAASYSEDARELGHPVLFGADYLRDLRSLRGDRGAASVIRENAAQFVTAAVPGSLHGIDLPGDTTG